MTFYVFRYNTGNGAQQDVPVGLDLETKKIEFGWPDKKVTFALDWVGDVLRGHSLPGGPSLGVTDEVEIGSMSEVSYRCQGSGVPYIGMFQGNLLLVV